ncbi:MAG: imidazole glycerol phosphate synthase subunit HisH [Verrucomicrobiota bacterium]|jgi:glutamine amidotransferase|nr:imidazole glycerol phosphate synthase subunit HisH [Verrucomicrobiota bacterium]
MIGVVDYGMGNLGSVANALDFLNVPARILKGPEEMAACQAVILPGVGAFGDCMANLDHRGYLQPIREWIGADRPFLGICLGLQVLGESSEESPGVAGFGVLPSPIVKFQPTGLKVPQIGWNRVRRAPGRELCPLFRGLPDGTYFYFVHSYYLPGVEGWNAGLTTYDVEYASAVWQGHVAAVQFHPEKSQQAGLQLLQNFVEWSVE